MLNRQRMSIERGANSAGLALKKLLPPRVVGDELDDGRGWHQRPRPCAPACLYLRAHGADGSRVVSAAKDRRTGDKGIRSRLRDFRSILDLDAAIDLEPYVAPGGLDSRPRLGEFWQHLGNELLPAESRINRHQQNDIDFIDYIIQPAQ